MRILQPGVAKLVEQETFPILLVVISRWVIGLARRTRPLKVLAIAMRALLPQLGHLVDDTRLQLSNAVVELGLVAAWSRNSLAHRIEIIIGQIIEE